MQSRVRQDSRTIIRFGLVKILGALALGLLAVLLRAFSFFQSGRSRPGERAAFFIIEPFGLGDVITFEPFIRQLIAANCEVRFCAREEWRVLYPSGPVWVPARIPWSSHSSSTKYRLKDYFSPGFRRILKDLRAVGAGCVGIDTRGDIRSVILLYLAGCRRVVTLRSYLGSNLTILPGAAERVPFDAGLRRWELNLSFLAKLGVEKTAASGSPFFRHLATDRPRNEISRIAFIAVAPWSGKLWASSKWLELAEVLRSGGWEVTGLCGPGQSKQAAEELGGNRPVIECNSIEQWAHQLNGFAAVVSLDSGPMHLADSLGLAVVALYGQGLLPLWAPGGPKGVAITHQMDSDFFACPPIEANAEMGRKFMLRITVAEVLAGLEKVGIRTTSAPAAR